MAVFMRLIRPRLNEDEDWERAVHGAVARDTEPLFRTDFRLEKTRTLYYE